MKMLHDIENDDLRQQVRDLQHNIENGDLRQQVRDLQRQLARLDERRGKSNPMRSNASERRSMDSLLFSDIFTSSDADEPSKSSNSNIFSMSVYDTPVYDEDIFYELPEQPNNSNINILSMSVYDKPVYDEDILSMPVYDKPVYDEDILSMPVYDKPVCDEDIFNELPGVTSESPSPSVKFDDTDEDEGMDVDDDEEIFNNVAVDEDNTQDSANDEQQLGRVKEWIGSYHLETVDLTDDVLSNSPDILVVLIEDIMDKLVKETFVTKVAEVSCVITTKKNFNYEFDAVKYEVDVQVSY
ncbi:hypothetical protein SASPL_126984 [Salvia splendens]|uniref:Uncharacterized protein n=1 Tax=Salvia splendens TaxID=180675 RepID=A0A8X8ZRN5_SALSN|nr:hypothetical protein SASPL_126984 [Salvia splendens]